MRYRLLAIDGQLDDQMLQVGNYLPMADNEGNHMQAKVVEIGDEQVTGIRPECQLARWAATRRRTRIALDDEAALDELADPLRHDRPAEPGPLDELGARPRSPEPDLVEDVDERVEGLVGQRAVHAGDHTSRPARSRLLHLTRQSTMITVRTPNELQTAIQRQPRVDRPDIVSLPSLAI